MFFAAFFAHSNSTTNIVLTYVGGELIVLVVAAIMQYWSLWPIFFLTRSLGTVTKNLLTRIIASFSYPNLTSQNQDIFGFLLSFFVSCV